MAAAGNQIYILASGGLSVLPTSLNYDLLFNFASRWEMESAWLMCPFLWRLHSEEKSIQDVLNIF